MNALCTGKPAGHPAAKVVRHSAGLSSSAFQLVETAVGVALSITSRYELSDVTTEHCKPHVKEIHFPVTPHVRMATTLLIIRG